LLSSSPYDNFNHNFIKNFQFNNMLPCNLLCFLLNLKCLAWLGAQFWYITDCPCYVYAAFLSARELPPFWPLADCVFSLLLSSALLRVHWILCFVFVKIWAIFWCFIWGYYVVVLWGGSIDCYLNIVLVWLWTFVYLLFAAGLVFMCLSWVFHVHKRVVLILFCCFEKQKKK
jgi:hypothetical protein